MLAEVEGIDLEGRTVTARGRDGHEHVLPYDTLVVAAGAETTYFGHAEWAADAPGLKSIEDAVELRRPHPRRVRGRRARAATPRRGGRG